MIMKQFARPARDGITWSREEPILAFDLYCRIPFNKTKANNPEVINLARILNRTPASVARKLGNFGAFDPELKKRNISGLTHGSKLDKAIWDEFHSDWGGLVLDVEHVRQQMVGQLHKSKVEQGALAKTGPTERRANVKQRIHQDFFRATVLAAYNQRCCICRIPYPELLIASHIIPWSVREDTRVNPENGLCLCATHDRAFDYGLVSVSADFIIMLCGRLKKANDSTSKVVFHAFDGERILSPDRFRPKREFLQWHFENVFER
jgi:putative restriction endonuclease